MMRADRTNTTKRRIGGAEASSSPTKWFSGTPVSPRFCASPLPTHDSRNTTHCVFQPGTHVRTDLLATHSKQSTGALSARYTSALSRALSRRRFSSNHQSLTTNPRLSLPATPPRVESRLTFRKQTTGLVPTRNSCARVLALRAEGSRGAFQGDANGLA